MGRMVTKSTMLKIQMIRYHFVILLRSVVWPCLAEKYCSCSYAQNQSDFESTRSALLEPIILVEISILLRNEHWVSDRDDRHELTKHRLRQEHSSWRSPSKGLLQGIYFVLVTLVKNNMNLFTEVDGKSVIYSYTNRYTQIFCRVGFQARLNSRASELIIWWRYH